MRNNWAVLLLTTLVLSCTHAQEWTRFRGPNGQGRIEAPGIPVQWTEADATVHPVSLYSGLSVGTG